MANVGRNKAEYGEDAESEISVMLTQIMLYIDRLERKMAIMIALADTSQNEDEKRQFIASTETLKDDHDKLKKRFSDFVDFYHFEEDRTVVFSQISAFMKQELDKNDQLRQLCTNFLSEEDQNYLDFLSDDDDNFIGFPPLEPRTNEGLARRSPDRGKAKLLSREDGEESGKEFEAIKKDGGETERFLKKLEGSPSETKEREDENISKIQGLEEKLQSLMLPGVSNQDEEDEDGEMSLKEWLKLHKNGNEDLYAANEPMGLAIDLAGNLSRLLLEFMITMSDREGIAEKLRAFKSTLKVISKDNDTVIIKKMVSVMEMVEKEAIDTRTKAGVSEIPADRQVDEFIDLFFEVLLHLENIIALPSLPTSIKLMKGSASALEGGLEHCNAQVKEVEGKVNELKKLMPCDFEAEKKRRLEERIVEMWDRVKREEIGEGQPATAEYSYPMQLFLKM